MVLKFFFDCCLYGSFKLIFQFLAERLFKELGLLIEIEVNSSYDSHQD